VLLIGSLIIFLFITKKEPQEKLVFSPQLSQLNNKQYQAPVVEYSGELLEVPSTLGLYQLSDTPITPSEQAEKIANSLQLAPSSEFNNRWVSPDGSLSLSVDPNLGSITLFTKDITTDVLLGPNFSLDQASETAKTLVSNFGITGLSPALDQVVFLSNDLEPRVVAAGEAHTVQIPFQLAIEGYPALYQSQGSNLSNVILDSNYNVIKAVLYPLPLPKLSDKKTTISIEQAVENIRNGSFTVIDLYKTHSGSSKTVVFEKMTLSNVALEFRYNQDANAYYPYYNFKGEANLLNFLPTVIELVTPAIETLP